jgi:uncharacterized protein (TIGR02453 family)
MINKETFTFLKQLKKNNTKEWFDANRKIYEVARQNVNDNIALLIKGIEAFDPAIAAASLQVKNCSFRINRDIRFSKNKQPYKTNMAMQFSAGSKVLSKAHYYVHIEPGNCFIGGGMYMPMPPDLNKIRQEIDYNFNDFKKIVTNKKFITVFPKGIEAYDTLQRPPKGYNENNPALSYLKMKGFIALHAVPDEIMQSKIANKEILLACKTVLPLVEFINSALD